MDGKVTIDLGMHKTLLSYSTSVEEIIYCPKSLLDNLQSYWSLLLKDDFTHADTGQYTGQQRSMALNDAQVLHLALLIVA